MRLIDADVVIETIKEIKDPTVATDILNHIIATTQTAYDVDKVVEELESAVHPYYLYDAAGCDIDEVCLRADMVENIIKRGGVNE